MEPLPTDEPTLETAWHLILGGGGAAVAVQVFKLIQGRLRSRDERRATERRENREDFEAIVAGLRAQLQTVLDDNEGLRNELRDAHAEVSQVHLRVLESQRKVMALEVKVDHLQEYIDSFQHRILKECPNGEQCPLRQEDSVGGRVEVIR